MSTFVYKKIILLSAIAILFTFGYKTSSRGIQFVKFITKLERILKYDTFEEFK